MHWKNAYVERGVKEKEIKEESQLLNKGQIGS